jgi:hypothetical protein
MGRRILNAPRCAGLGLMAAVLLSGCACFPALRGAATPPPTTQQVDAFGPMAGLVGKTWRSEPVGGGEIGPADISRWSWDLGGRVIVSRHALEDGSYGGVTYIYENSQTGSLDYVYVTSAGFHTTGTYQLAGDGSWTAEEAVIGHETITRVRSTGRITPDGRMAVTSEYFAKDAWSPGRNVIYVPVKAKIPEITGQLAQ